MIYEFSPKQDLHGYGKPWAPGAGKNVLNADLISDTSTAAGNDLTVENEIITMSWTSGTIIGSNKDGQTISAGTYAISATGTNKEYVYVQVLAAEDDTILVLGQTLGQAWTFTTETDFYIRLFGDYAHLTTAVFKLQIESGSTATAWTPYSNICPIEGYNIWDPIQEEMIQVYSGYVDAEARKLYLHPVYEEYDGEELVGPWMSSLDEYTEEGTPTTGAFVVDFGGEVSEYDITDFMLQTLLDSLGIRRFIASGAMLLNSLMDQAQGRVRSEAELLNRAFPIHVIAIGKELPSNLVIKKPVSDVLPVLPGKTKI